MVFFCKDREEKHLTEFFDKKRIYISRVENNGSNLTLKTLCDIVENCQLCHGNVRNSYVRIEKS